MHATYDLLVVLQGLEQVMSVPVLSIESTVLPGWGRNIKHVYQVQFFLFGQKVVYAVLPWQRCMMQ